MNKFTLILLYKFSNKILFWKQHVTKYRLVYKLIRKPINQLMLPTPMAGDVEGGYTNTIGIKNNRFIRTSLNTGTQYGAKLNQAIYHLNKFLPTPQAQDCKQNGDMPHSKQKMLINIVRDNTPISKLQPKFSEWMMGYPKDWTNLNITTEIK